MAFTSLAYLVDIDRLKEAYRRTRKDGAVGVDGVTAAEYEQDLEGNLQRLLDRAYLVGAAALGKHQGVRPDPAATHCFEVDLPKISLRVVDPERHLRARRRAIRQERQGRVARRRLGAERDAVLEIDADGIRTSG